MKIEDQVCTLEQAKRLKELGVDSKSLLQWKDFSSMKPKVNMPPEVSFDRVTPSHASVMQVFNAYNVAELGVMLPSHWWEIYSTEDSRLNKRSMYNYGEWDYAVGEHRDYRFRHPYMDTDRQDNPPVFNTEAECRAAILIYIIENNLTTSAEVNARMGK